MHPKGVYIMPQLCGGTAIVSHPRSQNIMYRLKPTLCTDYVGIMYLATARHRDKDFIADIFVLCYNTNMKKDKLKELSLLLADKCISIAQLLQGKKENSIANQIKRSGTSIAANIAEGSHPQSRLDMISKFEIALKEAFETDRWLQIIHTAKLIPESVFEETDKLCTKIRVLLISSIKTLKNK